MIVQLIDFGGKCKPERNAYQDAGADVWTTEDVTIPKCAVLSIGLGWGVKLPQGTAGLSFREAARLWPVLFVSCHLSTRVTGARSKLWSLICQGKK